MFVAQMKTSLYSPVGVFQLWRFRLSHLNALGGPKLSGFGEEVDPFFEQMEKTFGV